MKMRPRLYLLTLALPVIALTLGACVVPPRGNNGRYDRDRDDRDHYEHDRYDHDYGRDRGYDRDYDRR